MTTNDKPELTTWHNIMLAVVAVALWVLSFPPYDLTVTAWVALVPLCLIALQRNLRKAVIFSAAAGVAVNVIMLSWMRFVTIAGWAALAVYLGVYFLFFAMLLRYASRKLLLPLGILAPVLWVSLEHVRSYLFTGFPWFLIGHTQYRALPIIQIADITGVLGISFLLVMVAGLASDGLLSMAGLRRTPGRRLLASRIVAASLLLATLAYGEYRLATLQTTPGPKVALIQGNIPMSLKFSPEPGDDIAIIKKHTDLTLQAAKEEPDLAIWPETMLPAHLGLSLAGGNRDIDRFVRKTIRRIAGALPGHILIGALGVEFGSTTQHFNSAYYLSPDGELLGRYDKIHLVVFGEYTPLQKPPLGRVLGFLRKFRPPIMGPDVSPGMTRNLFELGDHRFGVTICYEDTVPTLFRKFVRDGADFMVNISNDGWFMDTAELDQHLAICVFRAVENRVPVARSANTGISSFVTPRGEIQDVLKVNGRHREVEGVLTARLEMLKTRSAYVMWGEIFGLLTLLASVGLLLVSGFRRG